MSGSLPDPERWSDRSVRATTVEGAVGATLRRVRQATLPSEAALARVARRRRASAWGRRSRVRTAAWRLALAAAALIMVTGGAVTAARLIWRRIHVAAAPTEAPMATAPAGGSARGHVHGRRAVEAPPSPPLAADAPEETPAPAAAGAIAAPGEAPTASVVPAPAFPAEPAANAGPIAPVPRGADVRRAPAPRGPAAARGEAELLAGVFRELRSGGDARAALRALDVHDRRFPAGPLRGEARIARAEALIALDRRAEALPLLDELGDGDGALTRNVRLTRAELRAQAGLCAGAARDFDALLAAGERDAAGARALYGRASCRLGAGEVALGRSDLQRYLALHPDGGFAAAARRALDSQR